MKVGFLSQPFDYSGPPDPGGSIGIWTWETARRLARSCEVLISGPGAKGGRAAEQYEGVNFSRFPLTFDRWLDFVRKKLPAFGPPSKEPDFASSSYYPVYARRAAGAFGRAAVDIIHIHQFSQFVPIIRRRNPRARIVLHMHSDWLIQCDYKVIDERLRHTDAIVGCSEYVTNNIRAAFPQYAARCFTVFNGVNLDEVTVDSRRPPGRTRSRIVFVGRVSPEKGLHVLLESFGQILDKCPQANLDIIGGEFVPPLEYIVGVSKDAMVRNLSRFYQGSYGDSLRAQVTDAMRGRVRFLGHIPRQEMIRHLREADVFVQPSIASEMFGMAIAEAMAAGIPTVATRICGVPEVVADGDTGLLVSPDDPGALAHAVVRLLEDPELAARMGRAARERVERLFGWEKTAARLHAVYREVSPESPGPANGAGALHG